MTTAWWVDRPFLSMDGMRGLDCQHDTLFSCVKKALRFSYLRHSCSTWRGDVGGRAPETTVMSQREDREELGSQKHIPGNSLVT